MHILFAGATGVVGRRIVPLLVANGHRVTGLTRSPDRAEALRALGAEPVIADVADRAALIAAVRSAAPDVVVHQLTDLAGADLGANARLRFVHVDDAATAAVDALAWPSGPVNVCDDERAAGRDWVPVFCAAVGAPPPRYAESRTAGARGADNGRARQLGWSPRHPSWRTGFAALAVARRP